MGRKLERVKEGRGRGTMKKKRYRTEKQTKSRGQEHVTDPPEIMTEREGCRPAWPSLDILQTHNRHTGGL